MGIHRSAETYRPQHLAVAGFDEVARETGNVRKLRHGEHAAFDLNAYDFEPLAGPRPAIAGDLSVRWDLMFRSPNGQTYGIVDAAGEGIDGRELFLVQPAAKPGEQARLIRHLRRNDMLTAGGPDGIWMTGVAVTQEGILMLMHSGLETTEITGALSGNIAEQEDYPPEMWAPAPSQIRDSLYGTQ